MQCATTRADGLVRLAERHARAHQRLGEIRREQHRILGGGAHARRVRTRSVAIAPAITASESRSVAAASKSGSLSSCRSRL